MMFSFELFLLNAKKINLVWLSVIFFLSICSLPFPSFNWSIHCFYITSNYFHSMLVMGQIVSLIFLLFFVSVKFIFTLKTSHTDFYQLFFDSTFLFAFNLKASFCPKTRYMHIVTYVFY